MLAVSEVDFCAALVAVLAAFVVAAAVTLLAAAFRAGFAVWAAAGFALAAVFGGDCWCVDCCGARDREAADLEAEDAVLADVFFDVDALVRPAAAFLADMCPP